MSIKLFNTIKRKKELFKPLNRNKVYLYTCGPTVYDFAHIGNFRTFIFEDILKRWLMHSGYEVKHVMNITDVDDKTIKKSNNENISLSNLTEFYELEFKKDIKNLNQITCFSNEGNKWRNSNISFVENNILEIKISEKFIGERGRINCSLKEKEGYWRWLGIQFVISEK